MAISVQDARTTVQTASGLDIVAGAWLILAPFILGYSMVNAALWNDILIGVAVIILSALRTGRSGYRATWPSWINVVLGVWLILAPFILGYASIGSALWNDIILGIIVGGLAMWGALATPSMDESPRA